MKSSKDRSFSHGGSQDMSVTHLWPLYKELIAQATVDYDKALPNYLAEADTDTDIEWSDFYNK